MSASTGVPGTAAKRKLAIHGGRPVRATMLPYGRQSIGPPDVTAVLEALTSDFLTTGPRIAQFEEAFATYVGAGHAVAFCNGTAALHAAAYAAGLGPGSQVVTTPLTFVATANCARFMGASVTFADVRSDTLTLDPNAVSRALSGRGGAIITCDYAGEPSDLDELAAVADDCGAVLIDDACHALGARYRGRSVGSIAPLTAFSLHPVKHVTAGEGGVVTTSDAELARRLRTFRTHGIEDHRGVDEVTWTYDMVDLGFNYRITDFQCALGSAQLKRAPEWLMRRRAIADRYQTAFAHVPQLEIPTALADREHAWHLYVVRLRLEQLRSDRAAIFQALRAENIGVNVHYIPVPWHSYYQKLGYRRGGWPVAEQAYERMLSLPLFPSMTDQDVEDVIVAMTKVVAHYAS
jgi:perosamine synthetase